MSRILLKALRVILLERIIGLKSKYKIKLNDNKNSERKFFFSYFCFISVINQCSNSFNFIYFHSCLTCKSIAVLKKEIYE